MRSTVPCFLRGEIEQVQQSILTLENAMMCLDCPTHWSVM